MQKLLVVFFVLAGGLIAAQQAGAQEWADEEWADEEWTYFSTGRKIGAAALNPLLGLGSYTMGDWVGGLVVTSGELVSGGLLAWEIFDLSRRDAKLALIPGMVGIGVAAAAIIFGFGRPFFYIPPYYDEDWYEEYAASPLRRVHIAVIPDARPGRIIKAVRVSYSIQF